MQGGAPKPPQNDDDEKKKRPGVSAWVVLGLVVGTCCMSSGLLSMLGGVLALLDITPERPGQDPKVGMIGSMVLCLIPSALMLAACGFSLRETSRMRRLVTLAESRDALHYNEVAEALGLDLESARALLDRAVREGFIDRALVEATEPHAATRELVREAREVAGLPVRQPLPRQEPDPPPALTPNPNEEKPATGRTRTCPFCKTIVAVSNEEKPRCTQCGIPFSSRA